MMHGQKNIKSLKICHVPAKPMNILNVITFFVVANLFPCIIIRNCIYDPNIKGLS